MEFTEDEILYFKKLLYKHSLDLLDVVMNEPDDRDFAKEILRINVSCMEKMKVLESELS